MQFKITVEDLPKIWGRYIFQVNTEENIDLTKVSESGVSKNFGFWITKRVSQYFPFSYYDNVTNKIIRTVLCSDLFGNIYDMIKTPENFVEYFNNYNVINNKGSENETNYTGTRYHRLLTSKELEIVFAKIKELNW